VKQWRELLKENLSCGSELVLSNLVTAKETEAFVELEECEDPESDNDTPIEQVVSEVFEQEEVAPPDFEELEANEE
jgi:hypothetical protein